MSKNKVLIPIDNPEFSLQILPHIQQLLNAEQNQLILLHVEPIPERVLVDRPGASPLDIPADIQEEGMRVQFADKMEPLLKGLRNAGYEVATDMTFGKAAQAIETYLEYEPIDLVAMTTHGRTGMRRVVEGSVAEHVLRHTHVPLLLLHANSEGDSQPKSHE